MEDQNEEKNLAEATAPVTAEATASESTEETVMSFESFGFKDEIMQGIKEAGFTEPTPIQIKAIPYVMEGHDLIGQALTGTGKTAAFGLPVMDKIMGQKGLNFLILVPTRELAAQVSGELFKLGRYAGIHTAAFTGGQSYSRQEKMLSMGIDALVATPGRLIDLIDSGHFKDVNPGYIVVDEADEMLDMGFIEDIKKIFDSFPGPRQTMLFSATMPRPVVELAEKILKDPIEITTAVTETANNDINQAFFVIEDRERTDAIIRLIDAENIGKAIIFCRTKEETDALNILLGGRGYNVNCLHGDMEQAQRTRVMAAFRRGEIDILVATDVAARGLDVDDVTHVFNFHMPFDSRGYVHRIGRTGRAGKTGTAITLVTPRELRQLEAIKRTVGAQIENRLIPTRTEVTSLRLKKIFHDLHDYELDMDILNQLQTLTVNQDVMVLLAKLVGHELSGGADQGPEHIGIEGQRLSNLLTPKKRGERRERGSREDRFDRGDRRERGSREDRFDRNDRRGHRFEDNADFRKPGKRSKRWEDSEEESFHSDEPTPAPSREEEEFNARWYAKEATENKTAPVMDSTPVAAPAQEEAPVADTPVARPPKPPRAEDAFTTPAPKKKSLREEFDFDAMENGSAEIEDKEDEDFEEKPRKAHKDFDGKKDFHHDGGFDRKPFGKREFDGGHKPFHRDGGYDRDGGFEHKSFHRDGGFDRKPFGKRDFDGERKSFHRDGDFERKPFGKRDFDGEHKFHRDGDFERKPFGKRDFDGDHKSFHRDGDFDRKPFGKRDFDGEHKSFHRDGDFDRKPFGRRDFDGEHKSFDRDGGFSRGGFRSDLGKPAHSHHSDDFGGERHFSGAKRDKSSFNRHDGKKNDHFSKGGSDKSWYLN